MDVPNHGGANGPTALGGERGQGGEPDGNGLNELVISVPETLLARYNARVLDPASATRVADQPAPRPTVYVADQIVVSGSAEQSIRDDLTAAARDRKLQLVPPLGRAERRETLVRLAEEAGHEDVDAKFTTTHLLQPIEGEAVVADAWDVLQQLRARRGQDAATHSRIGLNHLLTAARFVHGSPVGGGSDLGPSSSYRLAGSGGRQPVSWLGHRPPRRKDEELTTRRPVIAVLDTGIGEHHWFKVGVERNATFENHPIGLPEDPSDDEMLGRHDDPVGGTLDADTGHGTFIAGLIRQLCPDADVLSVRVMHSDGVVAEDVLLEALTLLALRQKTAQERKDAASLIDVVSLSMGYYHELPIAEALDSPLYHAICELSRLGVIVVAAAGNDGTDRPMYPAAFAPRLAENPQLDPECPPLIAIGALNPDGSTAMFSNAGPWVTTRRPGAALVSTFPPAVDGSGQPAFASDGADGHAETLDPDDFGSGFAVWSGTSFATPVFAAELARSILQGRCGDPDALDKDSSVARAWAALALHCRVRRP